MTDLRAYVDQIKNLNQLRIIKKRVSTKYEIAALTAKVDGTNAILFENIKESKLRLVANLVGTRARFAKAVNTKDRKSTRLNSSHIQKSRMPSSA